LTRSMVDAARSQGGESERAGILGRSRAIGEWPRPPLLARPPVNKAAGPQILPCPGWRRVPRDDPTARTAP